MKVREATPDDAGEWLMMRMEFWPDGSEDEHRQEIQAYLDGATQRPLMVLVSQDDDGSLTGFVELSIRPYAEGCQTDRVAYLEGWYVRRGARGQGVSKRLISASEEWARSQGCTEFASDAPFTNLLSQAAHEAAGFTEVEQLRCFRKPL